MLFNSWHIGFIIGSLVFIIGGLFLLRYVKFFQNEKVKNWALFTLSMLCFIIHISVLWYHFALGDVTFRSDASVFFIIFPCNFSMICLVICGIMAVLGKKGKVFTWLITLTAWLGVFGGFLTIVGENYLSSAEKWQDYFAVKSAVSHIFLLFGSLYLFTGGFFKIRVNNILPLAVGCTMCAIIAGIDILIFNAMEFVSNPMFELQPVITGTILYGHFLIPMVLLCVFIFALIWEFIFYKPEDRFYKKFFTDIF